MSNRSTVCVFCGSSFGAAPLYRDTAVRLGTVLGASGIDVIYGGGRVGLMGVVADTALAAGSRVTGIIPKFLQEWEVGHPDLDELVVTDSMHDRKRLMYERADAFVSLPGGLGTFDETIEVMTWTQLGLSAKPAILVNLNGYWDPFLALVRHSIAEGFARPENESILTVVETPEEVPDLISQSPKTASPQAKWI